MHEHPGAVVGKHRTSIDRTGLDPNTMEGELVLAWAVSGPPSAEAKLPAVADSCCAGMTWCGDRFPLLPWIQPIVPGPSGSAPLIRLS
jgi:hypothetical protein